MLRFIVYKQSVRSDELLANMLADEHLLVDEKNK